MTTQTAPVETHETHSDRLMRHAHRELANGDRLQASEKAWGAVAHGIKAVAARRGWRYETHSDAFNIIQRLVEETGDREFRLLFGVANNLHKNYYIDAMPLDEILQCLEDVDELLEMLKRV